MRKIVAGGKPFFQETPQLLISNWVKQKTPTPITQLAEKLIKMGVTPQTLAQFFSDVTYIPTSKKADIRNAVEKAFRHPVIQGQIQHAVVLLPKMDPIVCIERDPPPPKQSVSKFKTPTPIGGRLPSCVILQIDTPQGNRTDHSVFMVTNEEKTEEVYTNPQVCEHVDNNAIVFLGTSSLESLKKVVRLGLHQKDHTDVHELPILEISDNSWRVHAFWLSFESLVKTNATFDCFIEKFTEYITNSTALFKPDSALDKAAQVSGAIHLLQDLQSQDDRAYSVIRDIMRDNFVFSLRDWNSVEDGAQLRELVVQYFPERAVIVYASNIMVYPGNNAAAILAYLTQLPEGTLLIHARDSLQTEVSVLKGNDFGLDKHDE